MLTILIVDDEREELEGISFLIDKLGFQLNKVFANNGNQALEYLVRNKVETLWTRTQKADHEMGLLTTNKG